MFHSRAAVSIDQPVRATGLCTLATIMLIAIFAMTGLGASPAFATECFLNNNATNGATGLCHPGWEATVRSLPTNLRPGGAGVIQVNVYNIGAVSSTGVATVTDVLPPGVTFEPGGLANNPEYSCSGATVVTCRVQPFLFAGRGEYVALDFKVNVAANASGTWTNRVTVSGGGAAAPAETSDQIALTSAQPEFGISQFDSWFSNADGTIDTQAASHPYKLTIAFDLNTLQTEKEAGEEEFKVAGGQFRDVTVDLPPGLVGDPHAAAQCTRQQYDIEQGTGCPPQSEVGLDTFNTGSVSGHYFEFARPVYNLVPPPGVAAQFAFNPFGNQVFLDFGVRSGSNYAIVNHTNNIPQRQVAMNSITIWGDPAEASHDTQRGTCLRIHEVGGCKSGLGLRPLLTLPTSCSGPLTFSSEFDTWENASTAKGSILSHGTDDKPVGLTGCDHLTFGPSMSVAPDTSYADTPAGLTVELKVPQEGLTEPESIATSNIQDTTVTLPTGVAINPGQAAGLVACQPPQEGFEPLPNGEENDGPPSCPSASKVGTVQIATPLLADKLEGNVYILQSNPPDLKLLVAASGDGVNLKLIGNVHLNPLTGQLVSTFEKTPELPFTDFKLSFSGGAQAALVTPSACGVYTSTSDFTPWSSPFVEDVFPSSTFAVGSGPDGGACSPSPLPFKPELIAGATTDQAGGFTNFSMLLQRGDGQQRIAGLQFKAPAGLTGELANVPLCTNAQAESNTCPEASKIGHTVVESGPGPYPLVIPEPGQPPAPIYLTESYDGAPFGLSIVVPLHVGPFTLPTQRVRAKIEINPLTTQLTVTTGELPQIVAGVPTDLREVDAVIERPEFMVNPTTCAPQSFSGTAYGTPPPGVGGPGASAAIGSHFQVGSCQSLKFQPTFSASTSGKTSRSEGASLTAKVSYPSVPQGTEADIGLAKVELPKQLPSRLTTLQKACTAARFEANPASCPPASFIGHAVVHTPLLPVPLEGPAIFVSHGGEAFPSLEIVLQGDGVTVDLVGATYISKAGITSTTFKTIPDAPFSSFELTLPEGPYSALAANGNLCSQAKTVMVKKKMTIKVKGHRKTVTRNVKKTLAGSLTLPNEFIAQNGAVIHQSTPITVTGCGTAKAAKKVKHHKAKAKKGGKKK